MALVGLPSMALPTITRASHDEDGDAGMHIKNYATLNEALTKAMQALHQENIEKVNDHQGNDG